MPKNLIQSNSDMCKLIKYIITHIFEELFVDICYGTIMTYDTIMVKLWMKAHDEYL